MGKFKKTVRPEYGKVIDTTDYEVLMDNMDSMVSAMMPSVYNNAIELTKLIIENRLRKGEERSLMKRIYMRYTENHLLIACQTK